MTIARILLAMIPVALVSVIVATNSALVLGFLDAWKFVGRVIGLEFAMTEFGPTTLPPFLYAIGIGFGALSIVISCVAAIISFGIVWGKCGPKKRDSE